jgi:L-fuculose-phosphate aldolase
VPSEQTLRAEISDVARHLYERGQNAPGDGNISARLSPRAILCTPTGVHKGRLRPEQIVKVRFPEGTGIDGKPSTEIRMHLCIYEVRPDVGAIVHAHSPNAVALTVAGTSMERPVVPEAIQTLGAIPTVPYASPATEDVALAVLPCVLRANAFILERHGPVALGATLAEALARLEVVEHTAKITAVAAAAGGAPPIDDAEANRLRELAVKAGVLRQPAAPGRVRPGEEELVDKLAARVLERLRRR